MEQITLHLDKDILGDNIAILIDIDSNIIEVYNNPYSDLKLKKSISLVEYIDYSTLSNFFSIIKNCSLDGYSFGKIIKFKGNPKTHSANITMIKQDDNLLLIELNENIKSLQILNHIIQLNKSKCEVSKISSVNPDVMMVLEELSSLNSTVRSLEKQIENKNIELEKISNKFNSIGLVDYLTEIPNRRKFFLDIYDIVKIEQHNMIMMDFNNFKLVNQDYGHKKGDELLKEFTKKVQSLIPPEAKLYRLGGDEFAIISPLSSSSRFLEYKDELELFLKMYHKEIGLAFGIVQISDQTVNKDLKAEQSMRVADLQMQEKKRLIKANQ